MRLERGDDDDAAPRTQVLVQNLCELVDCGRHLCSRTALAAAAARGRARAFSRLVSTRRCRWMRTYFGHFTYRFSGVFGGSAWPMPARRVIRRAPLGLRSRQRGRRRTEDLRPLLQQRVDHLWRGAGGGLLGRSRERGGLLGRLQRSQRESSQEAVASWSSCEWASTRAAAQRAPAEARSALSSPLSSKPSRLLPASVAAAPSSHAAHAPCCSELEKRATDKVALVRQTSDDRTTLDDSVAPLQGNARRRQSARRVDRRSKGCDDDTSAGRLPRGGARPRHAAGPPRRARVRRLPGAAAPRRRPAGAGGRLRVRAPHASHPALAALRLPQAFVPAASPHAPGRGRLVIRAARVAGVEIPNAKRLETALTCAFAPAPPPPPPHAGLTPFAAVTSLASVPRRRRPSWRRRRAAAWLLFSARSRRPPRKWRTSAPES